jgi:hypothetical protein
LSGFGLTIQAFLLATRSLFAAFAERFFRDEWEDVLLARALSHFFSFDLVRVSINQAASER